jgi:hypothetical protein
MRYWEARSDGGMSICQATLTPDYGMIWPRLQLLHSAIKFSGVYDNGGFRPSYVGI